MLAASTAASSATVVKAAAPPLSSCQGPCSSQKPDCPVGTMPDLLPPLCWACCYITS
ncbi:hypothetical protein BDR03DRAFT_964223 [Suillus americanus]|nr:hypothetical protein BDR03DRAFT_964223 [Suillus americanus]